MNKLLRVLTLLVVLLGLGISCASAANVTLSFNPQTVELQPGSSHNIQILINQVPANGLAGFNISVTVADPTITNITSVSAPGWAGVSNNSTVPSSSVWITAANFNQVKAGDTNVSFGNITITGIKAGTTNLSIVPTEIDGLDGGSINPEVSKCQVNVLSVLPVANFTSNVTSGFAPLTVQFNDTSLNETFGRTWTFGDGAPSTTDANPIHTYNNVGTFTVNLTASNANGTNSTSKTITVNSATAQPVLPVANFTSNVTSGSAPLTVQFNDTSLNETSGRTWTFGDGAPSTTDANPIHTYYNAGTFIVNLTAINANGTNNTSKTITVNSVPPTPPLLKINDFKADVTSGFEPLTVNFTSDVSGSPTRWIWKFERSGTQRSGVGILTHTFKHYGVYDVTLTVRDASGHTDTMTKKALITVLKVIPPEANFTVNTTSGKAPLTVQFNDTSTNNPNRWIWSFGDGKFSTQQNPIHEYKRAGKYTVRLTVRNYGGFDSKFVKGCITVEAKRRHYR